MLTSHECRRWQTDDPSNRKHFTILLFLCVCVLTVTGWERWCSGLWHFWTCKQRIYIYFKCISSFSCVSLFFPSCSTIASHLQWQWSIHHHAADAWLSAAVHHLFIIYLFLKDLQEIQTFFPSFLYASLISFRTASPTPVPTEQPHPKYRSAPTAHFSRVAAVRAARRTLLCKSWQGCN